jgi:hypothetical protein
VVDWDYERDIIEVDLPADCDCPGVSSGNQLPVDALVTAAQTYVQSVLNLTAKQEGLPKTDKRVKSKTRMEIIRLATE